MLTFLSDYQALIHRKTENMAEPNKFNNPKGFASTSFTIHTKISMADSMGVFQL